MADAIGQVLSLGVGVSLSPVPIIAVVLMLGTPRARVNGPAFVLGWIVGLTIVGVIVLAVAGGAGADDGGEPATWVGWVKLVLGVLLLLVAVRQWRGRPRAGEDARAAEVDADDRPVHARALVRHRGGALGHQPEEPAADGRPPPRRSRRPGSTPGSRRSRSASSSSSARSGRPRRWRSTSRSASAPTHLLDELKAWMGAHNAAIMAVLCLVIGAKLIGDGISGLG